MRSGIRPWPVVVGLCIGIAARESAVIFPAMAAGLVAGALRRHSSMRAVGLALLGVAGGAAVAGIHDPSGTALERAAASVPRCEVRATVLEEIGALGTLATVDSAACGEIELMDAGIVVIDDAGAEAGERVSGSAWLIPLGSDSFDEARRAAGASARLDPIEVAIAPARAAPHRVASAFRVGLRAAVTPLEQRSGQLLLGLTIGDTDGIDATTIENFRRAGLSHLVAVSGSNVAIVIGAVVLVGARWSQRVRLLSAFGVLALFVLVVGPDPSVLRAAVMAVVMLLALREGVAVHPLRALGIALLVLVAARPGLVTSVGLHLSVAATAGIVLLGMPLADRLRRLPRAIALAIGATLGAQLAVAPLLIAYFEQLSLAGPIANLVVIPVIAPATILGLAAGAVGMVTPMLGQAIARAAEPFVAVVLWSGDTFGTAEYASLPVSASISWVAAVMVVGLWIALSARSSTRALT